MKIRFHTLTALEEDVLVVNLPLSMGYWILE